jgi:hypothetical protein
VRTETMKAKTLIITTLAVLASATMIMTLLPWGEETYGVRLDGMTSPSAGSFFDYVFSDASTGYVRGAALTSEYTSYGGTVQVFDQGNTLRLEERIAPNGGPTRTMQQILVLSSPLAQSFVNNWGLSNGALADPDGLPSSADQVTEPYVVLYASSLPPNVTENQRFVGNTLPWDLTPLNPNETGINQGFVGSFGPMFVDYDSASSSNILVNLQFSGNWTFVAQLFQGYGIANVTGFQMNLIGTNVDVGPLDLSFYLSQNILLTIAVWIVGTTFLALIIRRGRKRAANATWTVARKPVGSFLTRTTKQRESED